MPKGVDHKRVHIDTGLTSDWMNQKNYEYKSRKETTFIEKENSIYLIDAMTD